MVLFLGLSGGAVLIAGDSRPLQDSAPDAFLFCLFVDEFQEARLVIGHALIKRPCVIRGNPERTFRTPYWFIRTHKKRPLLLKNLLR
jgi:hypothetical protein